MSETALRSRLALAVAPLRAGDGALLLEACAEGRVVQALARPTADPAAIAARLVPVGDGSPHAVRAFAPGQWFVVSDTPLAVGELRGLTDSLGADVALSDQSHGRVRLAVEGRDARRVLAKGTGVDLAPSPFPIGRSVQTLFGHIGVHVTRTASDRFELIVLRSLAESLWDELAQAGPEVPASQAAV